MDSELKNEICPIIHEMFSSYECINGWAPDYKGKRRINWLLIIVSLVTGIGLFVITITIFYPSLSELLILILKRTKIDPIDNMVLVYIPAGSFKMGSDKGSDPYADPDETPQHTVYLSAYWIDQTEVTNSQYRRCVDAGECDPPDEFGSQTRDNYYGNDVYDDYPVIFIPWIQAFKYCNWVGGDLPSEAEWEKAARGLKTRIYPWGNNFDGTLVNFCDTNCDLPWADHRFDDGYADTSPVGNYPGGASKYGVLDMAGNVFEWVADGFSPYPDPPECRINPTGYVHWQEHIIRGGSWGDDFLNIRLAVRAHKNMPLSSNFIGFRCVREP